MDDGLNTSTHADNGSVCKFRKQNQMISSSSMAFYCVYLLKSISKPRSFYIGSTPNPSRRLAQHNGHLTQGAKRTGNDEFRPWEMVLIVHGFNNKISALQFEYAFQKSQKTHFIQDDDRIVKKTSKNSVKRSLKQYLAHLRLILNHEYFNKMGLVVEFFTNEEVYRVWNKNEYNIRLNDRISANKVFKDSGECMKVNLDDIQDKIDKSLKILDNSCAKCGEIIEHELRLVCYFCYTTFCLMCLHNQEILPLVVSCDSCGERLNWSILIKVAKHVMKISKTK